MQPFCIHSRIMIKILAYSKVERLLINNYTYVQFVQYTDTGKSVHYSYCIMPFHSLAEQYQQSLNFSFEKLASNLTFDKLCSFIFPLHLPYVLFLFFLFFSIGTVYTIVFLHISVSTVNKFKTQSCIAEHSEQSHLVLTSFPLFLFFSILG